MLPSYYEYHNPVKILSGKNALDNLPDQIIGLQTKNPIIITDKGVSNAGLIEYIENVFYDSDIKINAIFDEVPPDSSIETVEKIATIYKEKKCDLIIAVGGGSVIDTAKGVNILVSENSFDLMKFAGVDILQNPLNPFIVIPTTSGTGSEVTSVAVISNIKTNVKMAFTSNYLLPNIAVLDPKMTITLPKKMTAQTGIDALSHAMEAYTSLQKNPISDAFAFASIKLIRENLIKVIDDAENKDARSAMANASMLAGIAFSHSMVGVVHALGHSLGGICHIPHGIAMSIFLPIGLEYNLETSKNEIGELLLPFGGAIEYAKTLKDDRAQRLIDLVYEFKKILKNIADLPMNLKEAGISKKKF